jgi:hypothetical protein
MWVLGDRILYPEPEHISGWELSGPTPLDFPTCSFEACRAFWASAQEQILPDWIRQFPGSRPSYWWLFDAPRISSHEVERHGWTGCYFVLQLCEPRQRLGGIGDPKFEHLAYVPSFHCGVPDDWLQADDLRTWPSLVASGAAAIDPNDPPRFESQATYLRRHGLLQPGELQRLKAKDFEPEIVRFEEEETAPELPGAIQ